LRSWLTCDTIKISQLEVAISPGSPGCLPAADGRAMASGRSRPRAPAGQVRLASTVGQG